MSYSKKEIGFAFLVVATTATASAIASAILIHKYLSAEAQKIVTSLDNIRKQKTLKNSSKSDDENEFVVNLLQRHLIAQHESWLLGKTTVTFEEVHVDNGICAGVIVETQYGHGYAPLACVESSDMPVTPSHTSYKSAAASPYRLSVRNG